MLRRPTSVVLSLAVLLVALPAPAGPPKKIDDKAKKAAKAKPPALSSEEAIEAALVKKATCEFIETPLTDVADYFMNQFGINVVVDERALDDVGVRADTPLTAKVSDVSLASALNLILRQVDLTWTIHDEVLLITTPEENDSMMIAKVYPVADLIGAESDPFDAGTGPVCDYDSLLEVITSIVAPSTWDDVGGPGSIAVLPMGRSGALVVSQTYHVHRKVAKLLDDLRKAVAKKGPAKKAAAATK